MLFPPVVRRILAWREPVDMRKSFDGLIALTKGSLQEDPLSGSLHVFFNRRRNYLKLLFWDRTGFCLFAKRLERGRFELPGSERRCELSDQTFSLLLDGVLLDGRRALR
jgi:transposase